MEDLSSQPDQSVPQASRDEASVQGVYKFWGNPRVKASAILASNSHFEFREDQKINYPTVLQNYS